MLHLHGASIRRPQPPRMHGRGLQLQTDARLAHARDVALAHGEHFVVVRHHYDSTISSSNSSSVACGGMTSGGMGGVELRELPVTSGATTRCGSSGRKDVPIDYEMSSLES
ncbi:hypothetical protein BGW80DRAFT_1289245 [Lactifluus volemus]|nr:hypothetical protein BGW80DRAFT_1289245 [Lactifluus volemus]